MNYVSYEDFQKSDYAMSFFQKNPSIGFLKIVVSAFSSAVPIDNAEVTVYKDIGDMRVVFFQGKTDVSGIIDDIMLPSPKSMNFGSLDVPDYEVYSIDVQKEGFEKIVGFMIGVFDGIKIIQNFSLKPLINLEIR